MKNNNGCEKVHVDLLHGIEPQRFADIVKSVARQSGGGQAAASFWPDMAGDVVRNVAVVARAFDATQAGIDRMAKYNERPYSLAFIYQLAMNPEALLEMVLNAINDTIETDCERIHEFTTPELFEAMAYLKSDWLPMDPSARAGIQANIAEVMGGVVCNADLRRRLGSGNGAKVADDPQLYGQLACTKFSDLEFGLAGRRMNAFLEAMFPLGSTAPTFSGAIN